MKKIIAIAAAALVFAGSSFAFDFGIGGKAILGRNLAEGETVSGALKSATTENVFDFGGSAYANLTVLGGLGVQLEANLINSSVNFKAVKENGESKTDKYETMLLDIAPMLWWNGDIWKLRIGLGVGPNFSITLNNLNELKTASKDQFVTGLCAGADVRLYFTDHFGIVVSGRYVGEFNKKENNVEVAGVSVAEYPTVTTQRQTLYGGIGAEFKLF